jgi:sugar-specific transcriptional regulator TrmB
VNELIQKLKTAGFTEYESKVFLSLLQGAQMTATEVAENARIIRTDVYKVLRNFVEKGYCNEIETNSVLKYEMIDPSVILDKIKTKIIYEKEKEVGFVKDVFRELLPLHKSKADTNNKITNVELIRGFNQHREAKFIDILKKSKKEILYMTQPEFLVSDEADKIASKFIKNGGVIKSVYQASINFKLKTKSGWKKGTLKDFVKTISIFEKYGEKIKISIETIPNITIFDKETVFININDKSVPKHSEADIIIKSKTFAESMIAVFKSFYEKGLSINQFKKVYKNNILNNKL